MFRKGKLTELAGRLYWREVDARRVVEAWRRSGETVSAFAGHLGVDPRRVSRWASRLRRPESAPMSLHPVRVARDDASSRRAASIEIELGDGRRIRVAPGVEAEDLRRVLAVLDERAPC